MKGRRISARAVAVIDRLAGMRVAFITNNASRPPDAVVEKLAGIYLEEMGLVEPADALVLSTCNRSELYVAAEEPERVRDELVTFLRDRASRPGRLDVLSVPCGIPRELADGLAVGDLGTVLAGAPCDVGLLVARDAARAGTPMVFVDRWIPGLDVPVVRADGSSAVRDLVAHLHGLGHRRLAIIAGPAATTTGSERVTAFRDALAAYGLELPDEYIGQGDFQAASGRRATERFLELPEPPEVVFAADNLMALGALDAIRARGLRIPHDIALAAFDDIPWFVHTDPPITAIAQPTGDLGRAAVRALTDLIEGRTPESVTLPARLVVRGSCGESPTTGTDSTDRTTGTPGTTRRSDA